MIRCLVLSLCVMSINGQTTEPYTYDEEYKTLLYELVGNFGGSVIQTIVNNKVVSRETASYTVDVWPVNTTIFPDKEDFYVIEQISTDIIRKSLLTVSRDEEFTEVIINRYNFTAGVNPPDDPTGSTFFTDLTLNSLISLNNCNGTLYISNRFDSYFTGQMSLCEMNGDNPPTYFATLGCYRAGVFNDHETGNYTDYYTYPILRRPFPPGWYVRSCELEKK